MGQHLWKFWSAGRDFQNPITRYRGTLGPDCLFCITQQFYSVPGPPEFVLIHVASRIQERDKHAEVEAADS